MHTLHTLHVLHVRLSDALPKGNAACAANASASASCNLLDGMAVVVYMVDNVCHVKVSSI